MKKRIISAILIIAASFSSINLGGGTVKAEAYEQDTNCNPLLEEDNYLDSEYNGTIQGKTPKPITSVKNMNNVVIFIKFKGEDDSDYDSQFLQNIQSYYNGSSKSLKDYYYNLSNKNFEINSIFPQVEGGKIYAYESSKAFSEFEGFGDRSELFNNAINSVKDKIPSDINLDSDNNGDIDNVTFIVNHQDSRGGLFWSHFSSVNRDKNVEINGKCLYDYNLLTTDAIDLEGYRVISHEFGHALGLPDFYDNRYPMGRWTMMSYNAGYFTTYERMKYTPWVDEKDIPVITESGVYEISDVTNDSKNNTIAYRIPIEDNDNEYFMVEYRNKDANVYENEILGSSMIVTRVRTDVIGNFGAYPEEELLRNGEHIDQFVMDDNNKNKTIPLTLVDGSSTGMSVTYLSMEDGKLKFKLNGKSDNMATIYYKKNSNFTGSNVYIHYNVNKQGWTSLPGKAMTKIDDNTYKTVIDLRQADGSVNFCFNDGNNHWDSRNQQNYNCSVGSFSIENETIHEIENSLNIKSINTDRSECTVNGLINISAEASDGQGTILYKFTVIDKSGNEKLIKDYSDSNETSWIPNTSGEYKIKVTVKDNSGSTVSKMILYNVLSAPTIKYDGFVDKASPQGAGTKINLNLIGSGGIGTLKYKVIIDNRITGKEECIQNYSTNNKLSWTPSSAGNYGIIVFIMDDTGAENVAMALIYDINDKFEVNSLTTSVNSPQAPNSNIVISAKAINAKAYRFLIYKDGKLVEASNYTEANSYVWNPKDAGTYIIKVRAINENGVKVDKSMRYSILADSKFEINSLKANVSSPQKVNSKVTFDTVATGEKLTYRYFLYKDGKYKTSSKRSSNSSISVTMKTPGNYSIKVSVIDANGKQLTKYIDYIVTE